MTEVPAFGFGGQLSTENSGNLYDLEKTHVKSDLSFPRLTAT